MPALDRGRGKYNRTKITGPPHSPPYSSSHVQTFDLPSLSVRLHPCFPSIPISQPPCCPRCRTRKVVSPLSPTHPSHLFFSPTLRSRNAAVKSRCAIDALGLTGRCHAPTTYRTIRSEKCHPCRRARPVYLVGEFILRDRFIHRHFISVRLSAFRSKKKVSVAPLSFSIHSAAHTTICACSDVMQLGRSVNDASWHVTKTNACTTPPQLTHLSTPPHRKSADLWRDERRHQATLRIKVCSIPLKVHRIGARCRCILSRQLTNPITLRRKVKTCLELLCKTRTPPLLPPSLTCHHIKTVLTIYSLTSRTPITNLIKHIMTKAIPPTTKTR